MDRRTRRTWRISGTEGAISLGVQRSPQMCASIRWPRAVAGREMMREKPWKRRRVAAFRAYFAHLPQIFACQVTAKLQIAPQRSTPTAVRRLGLVSEPVLGGVGGEEGRTLSLDHRNASRDKTEHCAPCVECYEARICSSPSQSISTPFHAQTFFGCRSTAAYHIASMAIALDNVRPHGSNAHGTSRLGTSPPHQVRLN